MPSTLQALGHPWIDVMKIDVEGSEFDTFEELRLLKVGMPFTQLQIEVHFGEGLRVEHTEHQNAAHINLLSDFMESGLRTISVEPNIYFAGQTCMEFAMIQMDDCGNVVTPS